MKIKIINTGNRKIDSLLNQILKRAIKINKLKKAQKVGRSKRAAYEAKQVSSLMKQFPNEFKQAKREYKTLRGATNFLAKYNASQLTMENFSLVQDSLGKVGSIERITKRQAAGLPPLTNITGVQINKMLTQSMEEHGITGPNNAAMREHIRRSYEKSNQWQLHRSWRNNRDELKLKNIIDEGVRQANFEPLDTSLYSKKTIRKNFYSAEITRAMEEYERVNDNGFIPMSRRAGWVNIYHSDKVQAEIDRLLASTDEFDKMTFQDERMRALKYIIEQYNDPRASEGMLDDLVSP